MNLPGRQGEELFELIGDWCNGALDDAGMARLDRHLAAEPEARRLFLDYMGMHAHLYWDRRLLPTLDRGKDQGGEAPPPPATPSPLLGFLGNLLPWGQDMPGMRMFVWMLAGLVGMLVGLPAIMAVLAVFGPSNRPAAQVIAATNCQWTDAAAVLASGAQLRVGQRINLTAGELQIAFAHGAVVAVRGPSALEIESEASARLLVGSLTAKAESEQSHGFTVHLPTASVVDLGTEFRIDLAESGQSRVSVARGAVELCDAKDHPQQRVEAGQAVEVEPGHAPVLVKIEAGAGTPAFKFPTIESPSDKDYADAAQRHASIRVVENTPIHWCGPVSALLDGRGQSHGNSTKESFAFCDNKLPGKLLLDLGKTVEVRKINTYSWHSLGSGIPWREAIGQPTLTPGKFAEAAAFRGSDLVKIANHGFTDEAGTMEAWVMFTGPARGNFGGTILRLDYGPHGIWSYHILQRTAADQVNYAVFKGPGPVGPILGIASSPLSLNAWHHVVATHDAASGALQLFVDGVSQGIRTGYKATECNKASFMSIGGYATVKGIRNGLVGLVDEVRLSSVVRQTRRFDPPTEPYVSDAGTTLLAHLDRYDPPAAASPATARAPQRYTLYGSFGYRAPPTQGDPAAHGWTRIGSVDTDEAFSVAPDGVRPAQQAVSIAGVGGPIGRYRYLLWEVRPTRVLDPPLDYPEYQDTLFGELDVYAEERD